MALPSAPTNPTPGHGANTDASAATQLAWTAAGATSCRVYLTAITTGPVRRPTTDVAGLLLPGITMSGTCTDLGGGSFAFNHNSGNPEAQTLPALGSPITYAWQVIAINATGETTGPVWTFSNVAPGEDVVSVFTSTTTGTINDFNAGTFSNINVLRMNNATLATMTGLTSAGATPSDGMLVWIESVGAGQVDIANQSASSTTANRIITGVTGTISLAAGVGRALLCYDGTTGRWRVLEHEQGAWIDVPFNATDFTASGGTATVASGDMRTFRYWLKGRSLTVSLGVIQIDLSASPARIDAKIPGGFIAAVPTNTQVGAAGRALNGNAGGSGTFEGVSFEIDSAANTKIRFMRDNGSTWTTGVDAASLSTTSTFEVQ